MERQPTKEFEQLPLPDELLPVRVVRFDKKTFERLLKESNGIYKWLKEGQPSLHGMDPEFEHKIIKTA